MQISIVIPYFKKRFLREALESIAAQTSPSFSVFIGDDASPEDPSEVIASFKDRLTLVYHRFPTNLGQHSIAAQWNRCVAHTRSEWVWVFSDDDMMDPGCVAAFQCDLERTKSRFDLYRFNTDWIDDDGGFIRSSPPHPVEETAEHLALSRFKDQRSIFVPEHIFSRKTFDRCGGFMDLPVAWFTDDATWTSFSKLTGIRTIPQARVSWRYGSTNLSSSNPRLVTKKLEAFRLYLKWLGREFPSKDFQDPLRQSLWPWFNGLLVPWGGKPPFWSGVRFWIFFCLFTRRINRDLARQLFR